MLLQLQLHGIKAYVVYAGVQVFDPEECARFGTYC